MFNAIRSAAACALLVVAAFPAFSAETSHDMSSMKGMSDMPGMAMSSQASPSAQVYKTEGVVKKITADTVSIAHHPVAELGWPAMTMTFALPKDACSRVPVGFRHPAEITEVAMKRHTLSLWLGGVLLTASVSAAQAAELSLQQTLLAAEHYSAALSANRNQSDALNAMADSARQLPDPKLKFGIENVPVQGSNNHRFSRDGMTMQRIGIMQDYVSEEKRDRKADTILAQSASSQAKAEVIRANLQRDTAQAWLDLALSERVLTAARKLVSETERQIGVQKATVASGSSPASGVVDIRMTLLTMQDKVTLAERDVTLAQTRLLQLTGQTVDSVVGTLPRYQRLPADPAVLEEGVMQHPEVVEAAREADVARAKSAQVRRYGGGDVHRRLTSV
ncbi:hypothetical protein BBAD15_g3002 [Beauveria bassiana D1-5]|uniref:Uncharacterized protein n=1 Tax=Beauveria bassiana D1-5 TaxID=1245745 RepID=A0A0A2WDP0_BEABA|nr:hypothetical protein BBAD15_g3002 [Beauveria bassiana D1-5]